MRFTAAALAVGLGATQAMAYNQALYADIHQRQVSSPVPPPPTTPVPPPVSSPSAPPPVSSPSAPVSSPPVVSSPTVPPTSTSGVVSSPSASASAPAGAGGPGMIGDFQYLGCLGSQDRFPGWFLAETSTAMTREICASSCNGKARFFGVAGPECYCGDDAGRAQVVPNAQCNIACPGNAQQTCGGSGSITPAAMMNRRQLPTILLLSVYVNVFFNGGNPTATITDAASTATVTVTTTDATGGTVTTTATTTIGGGGWGPCHGPWCPRPIPTPGPKFPCHGDDCFKRIVCYGDWCDYDFPCVGEWCNVRVVCHDDICKPEPCRDGSCHKRVCCKNGDCKYDTCKGDECNKKTICYGDYCEDEKCYGDDCKKNWVCKGDECKHEQCKGDSCYEKVVCEGDKCKPEPPCKDCAPPPVKPVTPVKPVEPVYPDGGDKNRDKEHVVVAGAEKAIASFAVLAFAGAAVFL